MHIISFVTQKGGTGKSTLALNLAVAAEAKGAKVVVLDLDPQGTAAAWFESRAAETPAVLDHNQVGKLDETLARLARAGYTLAVIDTPGVDSPATRDAMNAADLCLIPVRPSQADINATVPTIRALRDMRRPFAFVLNQVPPQRQARVTKAVELRLGTDGVVAPVAIAARMDMQYAYALGQAAIEYEPTGKAAAEVAELWAWCKKRMEGARDGQEKRRA
jgi:chromosome partitioning protein